MKFKKIIICIICVFFAGAIIAYPERYIDTTLKGILLWAECVVPSLFPFAVLSAILIKTGGAEIFNKPCLPLTKRLKLPSIAPACLIMSVASGYPAGSRIVADFYESGSLSKNGAKKLAVLCSTSGPLFIIGSVGSKMLNDNIAGVKIFIAHVISIIAVAVILSLFLKDEKQSFVPKKQNSQNILQECFFGGASAMLNCGAFIFFFYTISQIVCDFNLLYPVQKLLCLFFDENISSFLCMGFIEATGGCLRLSTTGNALSVPLCGFLITFGGFSIIFQQLSYLVKAGIKPIKFIIIKLIQATICFVILLFI